MLTAMLENRKRISLVDRWDIEQLKRLRKENRFYCPICRERVYLKLGSKRRWHFAHQANSDCVSTNETIDHLEGKKQLYEWLRRQKGVEVALEVYLPFIQRRPDLLIRYEDTLYALEYQCAPIDATVLHQRMSDYERTRITPIWIFGGDRLKRQKGQRFSIETFQWLTARRNDHGEFVLLYYCSKTRTFTFLEQLTPYSPTRAFASIYERSLSTSTIDTIVHLKKMSALSSDHWLQLKTHWRSRPPSRFPQKAELFMQHLLYRRQIPYPLFPIEAGWPSPHYEYIETPPHIWQSFLLLECIEYQPLHHPFSSELMRSCFQPYIDENVFQLRSFYPRVNWTEAIDGYLQLLCQFRYLEKVDERRYKRVRRLVLPGSTDEAVELDRRYFYNTVIVNQNVNKWRESREQTAEKTRRDRYFKDVEFRSDFSER